MNSGCVHHRICKIFPLHCTLYLFFLPFFSYDHPRQIRYWLDCDDPDRRIQPLRCSHEVPAGRSRVSSGRDGESTWHSGSGAESRSARAHHHRALPDPAHIDRGIRSHGWLHGWCTGDEPDAWIHQHRGTDAALHPLRPPDRQRILPESGACDEIEESSGRVNPIKRTEISHFSPS